jgi:C1A family cysteine protease
MKQSGMRSSAGRACFALSVLLLSAIFAKPGHGGDTYDPTEEIELIRAEIQRRGYSWTAGVTSMNRLPPAERREYLGVMIPPDEAAMFDPDTQMRRSPSMNLPAVWDWRVEGGVTPVKHQGQCGSCWAFCAVGAFESILLIETGMEYDLSEQQALVCNTGYGSCIGGWPTYAYDVFIYPGAVLEECMPYVASDTIPCTQDSCEAVDRIDCYAEVAWDINILKEKVYEHPISSGMIFFDDFLSYTGGCYEHTGDGPYGHCVLIVGWDDAACGGEGAWICKNSWGTEWGIDGFFYIKYGSCSIGRSAHEIIYRSPTIVEWTDVTTDTIGDTGWGHGLAWVDFDSDGDVDIFVTNRDSENRLYRNDGLTAESFVNATPAILADPSDSRGAAWGDYDNDGDPDLYVSNKGPNKLFRNDGAGMFVDITTSPVDDSGTGQTVSWADYDNDGDLDLYLVNNGPNKLFRNEGGGGFTDVTVGPLGDDGFGQGSGWADYDDDGDLDLYVANYDGSNVLLENQGDGSFTDATQPAMEISIRSTGVAWGDYDNDGDLDLFVSNDGENNLLRNDDGVFNDVTSFPLDNGYAGKSAAWGDYDLDGYLDLYLVNDGRVNRLFWNDGEGGFVDLTCGPTPYKDNKPGFGSEWADYDLDGDLDLYLVNNGKNKLFRNDLDAGNHWLHVDLVGIVSNASGQGARVWVTAGGMTQMREVSGASGYLSQGPLTAMFGLGTIGTVDTLRIAWPSGIVQTMTDVVCDQRLEVVEDLTAGFVDPPEPPSALYLYPVHPNPFSGTAVIIYDLPEPIEVDLAVYDVRGRLLRRLTGSGPRRAGRHRVYWNGKDASGRRVASGVYFLRLSAGHHTQARRVVLWE